MLPAGKTFVDDEVYEYLSQAVDDERRVGSIENTARRHRRGG